jgi:hypothetical protein
MSKQLLAKIGVFALIVVNLGAYYVFWPDGNTNPASEGARAGGKFAALAKSESPGKAPTGPATAAAAQPVGDGKTSEAPEPPPDPFTQSPSEPEQEQKANKLNGEAPIPVVMTAEKDLVPPPLTLPGKDSAKPPAAVEPLPVAGPPPIVPPTLPKAVGSPEPLVAQVKQDDPTIELLRKAKEAAGKGSAIPPPEPVGGPPKVGSQAPSPLSKGGDELAGKPIRLENSPWTLQMEIAGGQTTLTARLHKKTEFRIVCERVEMKSPDGAVVAVGKVTMTGPGLKGTCNRLTVGLSGDSLMLEGKAEVQIQQGGPMDFASPAAEVKGEQISLRLQQPAQTQTQPQPLQPAAGQPAGGQPVGGQPSGPPWNAVPAFPSPGLNPSGPPSPGTPPQPFPLGKKLQ